jgi:hypothetical protein
MKPKQDYSLTAKAREALAQKVAAAFSRLADHKEDVEKLWREFENLEPNSSIMGCKNKTEFCEKILGRSIRTVQYLLVGGNHNRRDTVSPVLPATGPTVEPLDSDIEVAESVATVPAKTNFNAAGTRGYEGKSNLNLFIRKLMAIGAAGITSPFPSVAEGAIEECDSREAAEAVICNLNLAIERLSEYRDMLRARYE